MLLVATALVLTAAGCGLAAVPDRPAGVLGSRKLGAAPDCSGVVAFSGAGAEPRAASSSAADADAGMLAFRSSLTDRGVGWSTNSGEFTCHCPGLYQLSFAAYGSPNARVILKKQISNHTDWNTVLSTGFGGGANIALLDMDVGDKAALFLHEGTLNKEPETSSFSGFRVAKK